MFQYDPHPYDLLVGVYARRSRRRAERRAADSGNALGLESQLTQFQEADQLRSAIVLGGLSTGRARD